MSAKRDILPLMAILTGLTLGGLNLLSLPGRLAEASARLNGLREQVQSLRSTAGEANALEEEIKTLEAKVQALLGRPIPEGAFAPTVAGIALQSGWKDLALSPAEDRLEGPIRYKVLNASWTATWEALLSGIDALKGRGIFLKELEVGASEKGLKLRGVLLRPEPAEGTAPRRSP